jgi:hypothetical protein
MAGRGYSLTAPTITRIARAVRTVERQIGTLPSWQRLPGGPAGDGEGIIMRQWIVAIPSLGHTYDYKAYLGEDDWRARMVYGNVAGYGWFADDSAIEASALPIYLYPQQWYRVGTSYAGTDTPLDTTLFIESATGKLYVAGTQPSSSKALVTLMAGPIVFPDHVDAVEV